ncbi:MAG: PRC-barrel domain-containing protein [Methanosarcina sp.]
MANRDNPEFLSAESLMDDKVINTDGEDLGKFEDLMIDLADGRIAYAALSFGGIMGLGTKLFAIPWKALTLRVHEHAFVLDVPKEVLKKAEGFEKDNWPATSRESLSTMYGYYGYRPYWETGATEGVQLPGHTVSETTTRTGEAGSGFLRATKIQGEKVVNREGDSLGKIEDLMFDLQDGRIAYAVISHGGILGIGSKHIAIPWQGLTQRTRNNEFVLDIPKETLDKAEGLDKDKWPVTREELSRTFSYYGYQPYWPAGAAVGAAGVSAAAMGTMESKRTTRIETTEPGMMETERREIVETEDERTARMERERLEGLRETEQERLARLERERVQTKEQAEAQREKLMALEREQVELERQAQAERDRLAKLEREMEEARRREETQKVTRLEEEARMLQTQEATRRERLSQLEAERSGLQRETETEQERVARLEKERMEAEMREAAEKEKLDQLERERMNLDKQAETEQQRLARLERERMEMEQKAAAERERLSRLESERMQTQTMARTATTEGAVPHFLSASTIRSDRVVNTAGEDLGKIEELMIDLQDGRVAYAVLSFGGFMGMADKLFAIPWQALSLRAHEHAFTLDIPKEVLERAEGFDKNNWPLSREELSRTYTYYGYQPYWQTTGGMGRSEVSTGTMRRETEYRETSSTQKEEMPLETAEERMARQEKERIENLERKETNQEKLERLEREKMIAERRENKYK